MTAPIRKTTPTRPCPDCHGTGHERCHCAAGRGHDVPRATCEDCGTRFHRHCDHCDGHGKVGCSCRDNDCGRCDDGAVPCPECDTGFAGCPNCGFFPDPACRDCDDTGRRDCDSCEGRGEIRIPEASTAPRARTTGLLH